MLALLAVDALCGEAACLANISFPTSDTLLEACIDDAHNLGLDFAPVTVLSTGASSPVYNVYCALPRPWGNPTASDTTLGLETATTTGGDPLRPPTGWNAGGGLLNSWNYTSTGSYKGNVYSVCLADITDAPTHTPMEIRVLSNGTTSISVFDDDMRLLAYGEYGEDVRSLVINETAADGRLSVDMTLDPRRVFSPVVTAGDQEIHVPPVVHGTGLYDEDMVLKSSCTLYLQPGRHVLDGAVWRGNTTHIPITPGGPWVPYDPYTVVIISVHDRVQGFALGRTKTEDGSIPVPGGAIVLDSGEWAGGHSYDVHINTACGGVTLSDMDDGTQEPDIRLAMSGRAGGIELNHGGSRDTCIAAPVPFYVFADPGFYDLSVCDADTGDFLWWT